MNVDRTLPDLAAARRIREQIVEVLGLLDLVEKEAHVQGGEWPGALIIASAQLNVFVDQIDRGFIIKDRARIIAGIGGIREAAIILADVPVPVLVPTLWLRCAAQFEALVIAAAEFIGFRVDENIDAQLKQVNFLEINGRFLPFDHPIKHSLEHNGTAVVVLQVPCDARMNENVFGVDVKTGTVRWSIERLPRFVEDSPYTEIEIRHDELLVTNWDGAVYEIDSSTGTLLHQLVAAPGLAEA